MGRRVLRRGSKVLAPKKGVFAEKGPPSHGKRGLAMRGLAGEGEGVRRSRPRLEGFTENPRRGFFEDMGGRGGKGPAGGLRGIWGWGRGARPLLP